jgi:siroheme synthase-like protein
MAGAPRGDNIGRDFRERRRPVRCLPGRAVQQRTIPLTFLPISLNGEQISALVVGGGPVGTRKALAFHSSGARVRVISPEVTAELSRVASVDDRLTLELKSYDGASDIQHAQIVVAATSSSDVNKRIASDARSLDRLVSVVDSPVTGSFISMAVHRAGLLTVGVSAGNVPPAAVRVRDAIGARFDDRYADAIDACAAFRSETLAGEGTSKWLTVHTSVITSDFCDDVESGKITERIAACRS